MKEIIIGVFRKLGAIALWVVLSWTLFHVLHPKLIELARKNAIIPAEKYEYGIGYLVPVHRKTQQGTSLALAYVAEKSWQLKDGLIKYKKEEKDHKGISVKAIDRLRNEDYYFLSFHRFNPVISEDEIGDQYSLCQIEELRKIPQLTFPSWSEGRKGVLEGLELQPPRPGDPPAGSIRIIGGAPNRGVVFCYSILGNKIVNPTVENLGRSVVAPIFYRSLGWSMVVATLLLVLAFRLFWYLGRHRGMTTGPT